MSTLSYSISNSEKTSSLEDFITAGESDAMTYSNFSIYHRCGNEKNVLIAINNVIYDYFDELKSLCKDVELTDAELLKYKYKPKLLSYDVYGSTQLYFIIMMINGMYDIKDFKRKRIKLIYKDDLSAFLKQVGTAENTYISKNRTDLDLMLKG